MEVMRNFLKKNDLDAYSNIIVDQLKLKMNDLMDLNDDDDWNDFFDDCNITSKMHQKRFKRIIIQKRNIDARLRGVGSLSFVPDTTPLNKSRKNAKVIPINESKQNKSRIISNDAKSVVTKNTVSISTVERLTIVGAGRVGKTSLVKRLQGQPFDNKELPTVTIPNEGLIINKCVSNVHSLNNSNIDIKYKMYDTPGQRLLQDHAKLFIPGSSAVLVMYAIDNMESFHKAKEWLEYIYDYGKGYDNIILIGNKNDLNDRVVSFQDGNNLATEHDIRFVELSCKANKNVNILMKCLNNITKKKIEKKYTESQIQKNNKYARKGSNSIVTLEDASQNDRKSGNICC